MDTDIRPFQHDLSISYVTKGWPTFAISTLCFLIPDNYIVNFSVLLYISLLAINQLFRESQILYWLREMDLNHRPLGYEPSQLPLLTSRYNIKSFLSRLDLFYPLSCLRQMTRLAVLYLT